MISGIKICLLPRPSNYKITLTDDNKTIIYRLTKKLEELIAE